MKPADFRCGTIAIVGRPNVGKSTLLNHLIGEKISITSRKAQTTRHRITGILTDAGTQYVFVDTPGFQTKNASALNRLMNRSITQALQDVDVILVVIEAGRISREDRQVFDLLPTGRPVVLAVNKIDRLADKKQLLPPAGAIADRTPILRCRSCQRQERGAGAAIAARAASVFAATAGDPSRRRAD